MGVISFLFRWIRGRSFMAISFISAYIIWLHRPVLCIYIAFSVFPFACNYKWWISSQLHDRALLTRNWRYTSANIRRTRYMLILQCGSVGSGWQDIILWVNGRLENWVAERLSVLTVYMHCVDKSNTITRLYSRDSEDFPSFVVFQAWIQFCQRSFVEGKSDTNV